MFVSGIDSSREATMVETGGRNPRRPPNFVASRDPRDRRFVEVQGQAQPQNPLLDRSSTEDKFDERPRLPPNYVSLRQLRDMRLKEREEQEREKEKEKVKQSNDLAGVPPDYTSLKLPQERDLKEKEEEEKCSVKEEESRNCSHLPPNFVSLRQLKVQQLRKEEEREKEEEKVKEKNRVKAQEEEKRENYPNLPPNYISLKVLRELRLQEKEKKEAEMAAQKSRLPQLNVREEGDGLRQIEVEINKKVPNRVRNLRYKKPYKHGCAESGLVWKPVFPSAGTDTRTGASSADAVFLPQNDGASHEVVMNVSHQNEHPRMNRKKWKKKKKQSRKTISGKDKDKQAKGPEEPMEVTAVKIGKELNTSSKSTEVVTLSLNENCTVKKGKDENVSLTESSIKSVTVGMEVKRFNRAQSLQFKRHNVRGKGKGREVNLSEQSHNVVPMSKVMEGPDGLEKVIGSKIENDKEQKGKGNEEVALSQNENYTVKKGNEENALTESSNKSITVRVEVKRFNGAQSPRFKRHNGMSKGKGKEVNLSEQSHNVVPLSKVMKGSDGVEEVIGAKIENNREQKGKGKAVSVLELFDQMPSNEEQKGTQGAGEVIRSESQSDKENGMGKNLTLPESCKWGGRAGDSWMKRNPAAWRRGRGHQRGGAFPARSAEHLSGGGGLVWVLKKSS